MYTCARRCPQISTIAANHPASWSLGPSPASVLHRSRSIATDPHDLHLRHQPPPPSSTPAHHKPRDILHNIVDNHSSLGDHMSTYRPCVHNHPIYIRLNCMLHGRGCSLALAEPGIMFRGGRPSEIIIRGGRPKEPACKN